MQFTFSKLLTTSTFWLILACSTDTNTVNSPQALASVITQNTWTVSAFSEDGNDRLYLFGGYSFVFANGGNVTANRGGATGLGTWNTYTSGGKSRLYMDFGSATPFERLNEDWEAVSISAGEMRFQHVSNGGGGVDLLTFQAR